MLSSTQLALLAERGEELTAEVGEKLYEIGDATYPFIAILEGEAAVLDGAGHEIVRHGASGFLGEVNLLSGQSVFVTAVVTQRLRYISLPREDLRALLLDDPSLSDLILGAFVERRELLQRRQGIGPENPSNGELSLALGIGMELAQREEVDLPVVGGGNSAAQAAVWLARGGALVTLLHRRGDLRETMSQYLIDELDRYGVAVRDRSEIAGLQGEHGRLHAVTLADGEQLPFSFVFLFLGAKPCTEWLRDVLARDGDGFILTGAEVGAEGLLETSVPGVYAAGDVRAGSIKRCATAVGEGAAVVQFVHERLARAAAGPGVQASQAASP
ncbi:MAG TPA: FAD-dependent oxidoreductase [Solirubrobacteraceae bacterium]